ncbi:NAD/NADP-dependent betaine aldehyde dehydrogenase [Labrenzia sp. THAF82]|uniref:betaine-aldehyde dehydrogenase n=1 Tax=Labrenzia sp. THAF82 TaxID=2587861 RepID=UPI001268E842|nr:betaine-aldehyde dehydrogenase [Labrenzia sp. THAF82]QFT33866.1 NAD/NADP-dependent betaine aldehyde dehydrogenase [Labrenzia sp. THAF82]
MRAQPQASHYVGGSYLESQSGTPFDSLYPATGEVIARIVSADDAIVDAAIKSAKEGQKVWAATPPAERGRILRRTAEILREKNRELSILETLDTGKPLQETLIADAASGADCLEYYGGLAATLTGEHIEIGGSFAYTKREPLGICFGIGAWNYPIQIACWKAAPALVCGNAMIFKPSEVTPLSALKLAEAFSEAGLPDGVFNVLQGFGDVGAKMVAHPDIAKVSLTGSVPTGAKVAALAGEHLKKTTLELGGKSPLIIFDDADIENAISAAINANFYSTGQICSNGTRVFVHSGIKEEFLKRLAERTKTAILGDPLDEATSIGPLVSRQQLDKVMHYLKVGEDEGARLVCGGNAAKVDSFPDGYFVEPTVFADVSDDMTIAREEIFGPVLSVLDFDDETDVVDRANDTEFGLAAGVFTRDIQRAHRVIDRLQAGTCWINTYNLTPIEMPFGGYKKSGIGRENGHAAIDYYSQIKSVYVEMGGVEAAF